MKEVPDSRLVLVIDAPARLGNLGFQLGFLGCKIFLKRVGNGDAA